MSECGCVYSGFDGDLGAFVCTDMVRARKAHRCCECGDVIAIGATYERTSGKWEGDVSTFKTCAACVEIRGVLFCEGWSYGATWEDIRESWSTGNRVAACINACETVAAKEKLAAKWRDHMEIEPQ
jgi:hypothetical protein